MGVIQPAGTASLSVADYELGKFVDLNGGTNPGTVGVRSVVIGNVASGATDSGNPVKIGLVYNGTAPTGTSGQRMDAQGDVNANLLSSLATKLFGEDATNDVMKVEGQFNYYRHVGTAGSVSGTIKSSAGLLHSVNINTHTTGGTYAFYDSIGTSGTVIAVIDSAGAAQASRIYNVKFVNALTIVSGSVCDITIATR